MSDLRNYFDITEYGAVGDGITDCVGALKKAADDAGRARCGAVLIPAGVFSLSGDAVIPKEADICFSRGGILRAQEGAIVKIESYSIEAGEYKIFDGNGCFTGFVNAAQALPQWWGLRPNADDDAAYAIGQAVSACAKVVMPQGVFQIKSTIEVPGGRTMQWEGSGFRTTVFNVADNVTAIHYLYKEKMKDGCHLTIKDIAFVGGGMDNGAGAVFFHGAQNHAGNCLNMESCFFTGLATCVDIGEAGQCHFVANFALSNGTAYNMTRNAAFIYFERCMNLGNVHFVRAIDENADGISNGIFFSETHSVCHLGTDVHIRGYQAVWMQQGGYDLGSGKEGSYAIHIQDCQDIRISDVWIASENTKSPDRCGLFFEDSVKCSIANSSVVNHKIGVKIKGHKMLRSNITVTGCQFENNNTYDIYLEDTSDVRIMGNNFLSTGSMEYLPDFIVFEIAKHAVAGEGADNIDVSHNSFNEPQYDLRAALGSPKNCVIANNLWSVSNLHEKD